MLLQRMMTISHSLTKRNQPKMIYIIYIYVLAEKKYIFHNILVQLVVYAFISV